ncbi:hypothetical protein ACP0HM_10755 [Escherichia coli]
MFARLLSPATESSQVSFNNLSFTETPPKSIIEAAATGAMTGLKNRRRCSDSCYGICRHHCVN